MDYLKRLVEKHKKNPILKEFLREEAHNKLLIAYLREPSIKNRKKLDEAFKNFYFEIRFTTYILSLIRFASIDFDKRERRFRTRSALILDDDNCSIQVGSAFEPDVQDTRLEETFSCPVMHRAIQRLTKKEKEVLVEAYLKDLTDTEIAKKNNVSQQAISKLRNRALKKIQEYIS